VIPVEAEEEDQPEYSPLAQLIYRPYRQQYLHLCGAQGFVPFVTVCQINRKPVPISPKELELQRRRFAESKRFGVLPNIRVNYRDYGLDEETNSRILSLYD